MWLSLALAQSIDIRSDWLSCLTNMSRSNTGAELQNHNDCSCDKTSGSDSFLPACSSSLHCLRSEIFYFTLVEDVLAHDRKELGINLWCFHAEPFVLNAPDITFRFHQPRIKEHFQGNSQLDKLQ